MSKKNDLKKFCKEHKIEIIEGAVIVAGGVVIGVLIHDNKSLKKSLKFANDTILKQDKRILELKNLCLQKDIRHAETISDGLRHGSPLCAQDMVQLREFLKVRPQAQT